MGYIIIQETSMTSPKKTERHYYLHPTRYIDSDYPSVINFVCNHIANDVDPVTQAVQLFYAVREKIRYDPYHIDIPREHFCASTVLKKKTGFCVEKALVLAAGSRVLGIPSRLGFADLINHQVPPKLHEKMGTNLFVFHGYAELFVNKTWVKATPAFEQSLCENAHLQPIEFDGKHDALFHPLDTKGQPHISYLRDQGRYADLPYDLIMRAYRKHYPRFFNDTIDEG